jgi:hypothetical protein
MKLTGKNRSTRRKTCPSATLSTTNPIWTDPGSNPGLRGKRPATNRLSHGTAFGLVQSTFLASSFFFHPHHVSSAHKATKLNKFHARFIIELIYAWLTILHTLLTVRIST